MNLLLALLLPLVTAQAASLPQPLTPDDQVTAGALCSARDKDYAEDRYEEEIPYCERNVPSSLKAKIYALYEIPDECRKEYTIDHFYPLSLGGNNSQTNLWPEHKAIKQVRHNLELELFIKLRDGKIKQHQALEIIHDAKFYPPVKEIERGDYCERILSLR